MCKRSNEIYKISNTNQYILRLGCGGGAYNIGSIFIYFEGSPDKPTNIDFVKKYQFDNKANQFIEIKPAEFVLQYINVYKWDYLSFNNFYKVRGVGDCGEHNLNQLVVEKKAIYTIKSQVQAECLLEGKDGNDTSNELKEKLKIENWPIDYDLSK